MTDLIERKAALDALRFTADEIDRAVQHAPRDMYLRGFTDGLGRAHEMVRDLTNEHHRCATCAFHHDFGSKTDGECTADVYTKGDQPVFTKSNHLCAAWEMRRGA